MSVDHVEDPTHADLLRVLGYDRREPTSIYSCWAAARDNARRAREVIPLDLWECINTTWHQLPSGAVRGGRRARLPQLGPGAQRAVQRHRPRDHGPRRRLAVHVAGPLPGAGRHDLPAGRLGLAEHRQHPVAVGAARLRRSRRLPAHLPRRAHRPGGRPVPDPGRPLPALDHARAGRRVGLPAQARPQQHAGGAGSPSSPRGRSVSCGPGWSTPRWTTCWPTWTTR